MNVEKGTSFIEVLVVVAVFSVIAIITTQSILVTLRSSKKSDSANYVRGNIDLALAVIERQLHNAKGLVSCTPDTINYEDEFGNSAFFRCDPTQRKIASGSATESVYITADDIEISGCNIICNMGVGIPSSVSVGITGVAKDVTGVEGAQATINSQIYLRSY